MREDSCFSSPEGPKPDRIFDCALLLSFCLFADQISSRLRSVDWLKIQPVTAILCLGSWSFLEGPVLVPFMIGQHGHSQMCKSVGKVLVVRLVGL